MQMGVLPILHNLALGPPGTLMCTHNLQIIQGVCHHLGVPLALEKVEGPSKSLTFLGILLDTENMEAYLPRDKLQRICAQIATWLGRKKARDSFLGRITSACNQGCKAWPDLYSPDIQGSSQAQRASPRDTTYQRIQVRPTVVEPLHCNFEWSLLHCGDF